MRTKTGQIRPKWNFFLELIVVTWQNMQKFKWCSYFFKALYIKMLRFCHSLDIYKSKCNAMSFIKQSWWAWQFNRHHARVIHVYFGFVIRKFASWARRRTCQWEHKLVEVTQERPRGSQRGLQLRKKKKNPGSLSAIYFIYYKASLDSQLSDISGA